jgi:hypothetical protein
VRDTLRLSCILSLALFSLLLTSCREEKRDERMLGTWQAIEFVGHPGKFADELAKLQVTFGRDFSYKTTADCGPNNTRSGPNFKCDASAGKTGTFKLGKIDGRYISIKLPPSGDRFEVEISADDPNKMLFMMWMTGDKVIFKRQ